jgi:MinD superfamily P-loop ATPase
MVATWKFKLAQKPMLMRLDKEKCTKCGICAKLCPVGNITMDGYPVQGLKCQYCLRCCSLCPEKALRPVFNRGGKTYAAVKAAELME